MGKNLKQTLYEGDWLRLVRIDHWESCERTHGQGMAVIVIAVTPDDEVLFVEQFRVPLQAPTIEMPAGLVGDIDAGESIEVSAVRELEEETGWTADHAEVLMIGPTSSGSSSEKIAFVRATGLRKVGEGGGDGEGDGVDASGDVIHDDADTAGHGAIDGAHGRGRALIRVKSRDLRTLT